jgi:hypothetical protein
MDTQEKNDQQVKRSQCGIAVKTNIKIGALPFEAPPGGCGWIEKISQVWPSATVGDILSSPTCQS